jgi:hypothetical protein
MDTKREMLRHMLAALAYRTQKALRGAPPDYSTFRPAPDVRSPRELVKHMTSVLGYACTFFRGGEFRPEPLPTLDAEAERFHATLANLDRHFATDPFDRISPERFLQGPLSDAMSHAGQLALLRRLHGSPVPPENFVFADVTAENLTADQPEPVAPDEEWHTPAGPQHGTA